MAAPRSALPKDDLLPLLQRAQALARLAHLITGPNGGFEHWSDTLPQLIGLAPEAFPRSGRAWLRLIHPEDRALFRNAAMAAAQTGARTDLAYRLQRGDGAWIHLRQVMEPMARHADGRVSRWFNTLQDVTEQAHAEEKIARLTRVYAVLSGINGLIVRATRRDDLLRDACRVAVEQGGFATAWIGMLERGTLRVKPLASAGERGDAFDTAPLEARAVRERRPVVSEEVAIVPLLMAEEAVGVLALYAPEAGFFDDGEMRLLVELAGDIAFGLQHIEKSERLEYLAFYDSLTGLANRTLFLERTEQQVAAARKAYQKLAVYLLDLERFKSINDAFGRQAGDALLRQLAERMLATGVDPARFAKAGPDQFAVIGLDVKSEEAVAKRVEARLQELFERPFHVADRELRLSAKVGIAVFPNDGADAETLFRNAEAALKKAKAGGERYLFHTEELTGQVAERLSLENQLRRALEREEFVLHYQPKIDVASGRISGVEALIRWQSPELGLVPPGRFIPLLEETGLIRPVGDWALKRAARDYRAWLAQDLPAPRIAVNVSALQLRQRDFVRRIEEAILDGRGPVAIDLEITESLMMADIRANIEKLNAVRRHGINIAIDDFGTGYSSLGYLARLPVQALKIDRSFIETMHEDAAAMTLVSTIISLAQSLRLKVIAEGVETEEQARFLRLLRCDEMQGYLISRPVPREALAALLRRDASGVAAA